MYKYSYQCGVLPRSIAITLLDKMILPIVLYGWEVWGFEYSEICESVQYDYYRRITGLSNNSNKLVLLGEMGRYPLALHYFQKCIKYWLKVIQMPTARYPYVSYQMIYRFHRNGRHAWATDIALLLTKFGFQHSKESEMKMYF